MSIIDRLNMLVRSEMGARGAARGPTRDEIRRTLRDANASLATLRRGERELNDRYQDLLDELARVEGEALEAARRSDDEAALAVLRRKQSLEADAEVLSSQLEAQRRQLAELRQTLSTLPTRAASSDGVPAIGSLSTLPSGGSLGSLAPAIGSLSTLPSGGSFGGSLGAATDPLSLPGLDRMAEIESQISAAEAQVTADGLLTNQAFGLDDGGAQLRDEIRRLNVGSEVRAARGAESALDRLRKNMNPDAE